MKKLFALVMVLAMALAIAVPALASGWDQIPETAKTLKDITVAITALEVNANTSVLGSLYEQLSVMYPVVKGTDVHFFVQITIPKTANLSQANQDLLKNKGLVYKLTYSDNLKITAMTPYTTDSTDGSFDAGTKVTTAIPETDTFDETDIYANYANVIGFEYVGEGLASGDCKITANISFNNTWSATTGSSDFAWDNDADGLNEYVVNVDNYTTPTIFTIYKGTAASGNDFFTFPVKDTKIDTAKEMTMHYGDTLYYINRAVNGDITFRYVSGETSVVITPDSTATTPATYATLKTAFDSYFTALGFGYADAKYMTPAHFTTYFGTISKADASITYPSGTVVVTEPTVNPPQTGDASTVVGFVMIALALVAAAAVTVKKVRA